MCRILKMHRLILIILCLISANIFAANNKAFLVNTFSKSGIPYHCPDLTEVKRDPKTKEMYAYTNYNGHSMQWRDIYRSHSKDVQIEKFNFAIINSDTSVGCVYETNYGITRLDPYGWDTFDNEYEPLSGGWHNNMCESSPVRCIFRIINTH